MQERGKMNTFHVKNKKKKHQFRKHIFIHSYNSEKKQLNLKLFNLLCTYLYAHTSAFKAQQTTIWKTGTRCRTSNKFLYMSDCVGSM